MTLCRALSLASLLLSLTHNCYYNAFSLFSFTSIENFIILFWKLMIIEFLLDMSQTLLSSVFAIQMKIFPLLQLLMLFLKAVTC
jgi:integral membrane sensor domain MASE1